MKIFKDRQSAGKLLAKHLKKYKNMDDVLVLGIPRGGVLVAAEVAKSLNLPLDTIVARKIGAPFQTELALGAVDPDGEVLWEEKLLEELRIKSEELRDIVKEEVEEIKRREQVYRQGKDPLNVADKTIILIDDGVATGATTLSAINYLKRHQAKEIILAVPVASKEAVDKMVREVGEVRVLEIPEYFQAVGQFYQDFPQVSDEEVVQLLS